MPLWCSRTGASLQGKGAPGDGDRESRANASEKPTVVAVPSGSIACRENGSAGDAPIPARAKSATSAAMSRLSRISMEKPSPRAIASRLATPKIRGRPSPTSFSGSATVRTSMKKPGNCTT